MMYSMFYSQEEIVMNFMICGDFAKLTNFPFQKRSCQLCENKIMNFHHTGNSRNIYGENK